MLRKILIELVICQWVAILLPAHSANFDPLDEMQLITEGEYRPLYLSKDSPLEKIDSFYLDKLPVTNLDFYRFVENNPKWNKLKIPRVFSEQQYLSHWQDNDKTWQPKQNQLNAMWKNQNSESAQLKSLVGKKQVVAMIYTHCLHTCRLIVSSMQALQDSLPKINENISTLF